MAAARESKPLYVDQHASMSVMVAAIRNQAALHTLTPAEQFAFLHRLYVSVDALAGAHRLYKLYGGAQGFMLSTNVAEPDADHATTLLEAARALLQVLPEVRLPNGEALDVIMALSSGPASSGLLGSVSLTYQLVGRSVAVAQELSQTLAHLPLVVTRSMLDELPAEAAAGLVPVGHAYVACSPDQPAEVFTLPAYRTLPLSRAVPVANAPPLMPAAPDAGDEWAQLGSGSDAGASTRSASRVRASR
jgi:class 3 adenylate cyclase